MSDETTSAATGGTADGVDLTKASGPAPARSAQSGRRSKPATGAAGSGGSPTAPGADAVPRSIHLASGAIVVQSILGIVYALSALSLTNQLRIWVRHNNGAAKKPQTLCSPTKTTNCLDVNKSVHAFQTNSAIVTVVVAVAIVLLILQLRRGTRWGRTLYMVVSIIGTPIGFATGLLSLLNVADTALPGVLRLTSTVGALAGVIALYLLFRRDSQVWFDLKSPRAAGARPGLGGLFRPRPPMSPGTVPARGRVVDVNAAPKRGGRAKTRADAESAARGAAAARTRAKASKSRRTDI